MQGEGKGGKGGEGRRAAEAEAVARRSVVATRGVRQRLRRRPGAGGGRGRTPKGL